MLPIWSPDFSKAGLHFGEDVTDMFGEKLIDMLLWYFYMHFAFYGLRVT